MTHLHYRRAFFLFLAYRSPCFMRPLSIHEIVYTPGTPVTPNVKAWRRRPDLVRKTAYANPLPLYMAPTIGLRGRRPGAERYAAAKPP